MSKLGHRGKVLAVVGILALVLVLCLTLLPAGRGLSIKASSYLSVSLSKTIQVGTREVYADPSGIDIGSSPINRASSGGAGYTRVDKANPANADGTIGMVILWFDSTDVDGADVEVATFSASGDNLSTRGTETLGIVPKGSDQAFAGLDMDVVTGDYIGLYHTAGKIERDSSGGVGYWYLTSDEIPCTSEAFLYAADYMISLFGEGFTPADIIVGSPALERPVSLGINTWTYVDRNRAANATGIIDTVGIFLAIAEATNLDVATFIHEGSNVLSTRDVESLGPIDAGSEQTFSGLDLSVQTGDYIGGKGEVNATIERSPYGLLWGLFGDYIPCDSETFSATEHTISLYGTGEVAACVEDISNTPATWAAGTVATGTDYWSSGSEPEWPLDDGECHFTVTNNSGGAVDITVKATNFTGGNGWTLTSGSPGEDTVRLRAGRSGDANEGAMVILTTSYQAFIDDLPDSADKKWELEMETPSSYTDGVEKSSTITISATCS